MINEKERSEDKKEGKEGNDLWRRLSVKIRHIHRFLCSLRMVASSPDLASVEWHPCISVHALSIPECSMEEMEITFGLHDPVFGLSSLSADVYSI